MNEAAETKVCPFCAETIKAAAKICPFCQHRQSRFTLLKKDLALAALELYLLAGLTVIGFLIANTNNPTANDFAAHRAELEVQRTFIERARQTPDTWFANQGTNALNVRWKTNVTEGNPPRVFADTVEVHFLDSQSNLVDVHMPNGVIMAESCLWLTGFISNRGERGWSPSELEVRFFDARTNLVDVQQPSLDKMLLRSHKESAFRVPLNRSTPTNAGVFYRVRVQQADPAGKSASGSL